MNTFDKQQVFWMSLAHPQGRLILEQNHVYGPVDDRNGHFEYKAHFHGLTRLQLIEITARSLAAEKRFSHQLRRPVSVLEHSHWLDLFLRERCPELAGYARLHDTPESFGHDIPKMMKSEDMSSAEEAVYRAFRWGIEKPTGPALAEFKKWDAVSAAVEATLFGYDWPWVRDYRSLYGDEAMDDYIMHVIRHEKTDLAEVTCQWEKDVIGHCHKNGLPVSERFAVDDALLSRIQHK